MRNDAKGFSLTELIVVASIFSMLMLILGMSFRNGNAQIEIGQGKISVEEAVRTSLYQMALEIRESTVSRVSIGAGGNTIRFQIPEDISSGAITWSNVITYRVDSTTKQLIRTVDGQGETILANDIENVNFVPFPNAVTPTGYSFTVIARKTMPDGRILTVSGTQLAIPRNLEDVDTNNSNDSSNTTSGDTSGSNSTSNNGSNNSGDDLLPGYSFGEV